MTAVTSGGRDSFSGRRNGRSKVALSVGMRDGVPDERVFSRALKVFAGVEVGHHRFLPGETSFPSLPGHLVNLHLGAPTSTATWREDGASWRGTQRSGNVEVFSASKATEQIVHDTSEDASVLLGEAFFRSVVEEVGADPDRVEVLDSFGGRDANVERILLSLVPELKTGGLGGELYVESLATALAVHLLREHSSIGPESRRRIDRNPPGGLPRRTLRLVLDHVDANLVGVISLAEVAAVADLSPRHFLRLFKESTGLSPHQYVIARRVERARGLLAGSDLALWRVADACGFAHQQHLSRHFKRLVGVSPGRYRTLNRR